MKIIALFSFTLVPINFLWKTVTSPLSSYRGENLENFVKRKRRTVSMCKDRTRIKCQQAFSERSASSDETLDVSSGKLIYCMSSQAAPGSRFIIHVTICRTTESIIKCYLLVNL